jgi:hypothetical protein
MIEFGGVLYYIDLDAFEDAISTKKPSEEDTVSSTEKTINKDGDGDITSVTETIATVPKVREVDITKFEIIRNLLDVVLDYDDESDTSLGAERALEKTSLSYKIAFNTLYEYGIIKEKE